MGLQIIRLNKSDSIQLQILLSITNTVEKYWVDDGCPGGGGDVDVDGSFQPKSYKAGLRCCSQDGKGCVSNWECPDETFSFDEAVQKCSEADNHRLCTKDEVKVGVCCGSGGSCDSYAIWTSTVQEGRYFWIFYNYSLSVSI